ncbi:MAG: TlpA family protein disulfide reductase [Actinomycetes bacterium]
MTRRAPIIAGIVGVAMLALVLLFVTAPSGREADTSQSVVGKLAPVLRGTTTTGATVDLDAYRGQWVLVNFFATWCPPCVAEHPELVKVSQLPGAPVQVVSVAFDDAAPAVTKFFVKNGGDWPVLVDATERTSLDYAVVKLPESYLIRPDGTVDQKIVGGISAAEIRQIVDAAS